MQAEFDSRKIMPGGLFFALQGARADGHDFLEEAAKRGAKGAVVSELYRGPTYGLRLDYVPDVLAELQRRAARHLAGWQPMIVGITGSLGKTTTRAFAGQLLGRLSPAVARNSQAGMAADILNLSPEHRLLLLEMSMDQKGQIAKLVDIAPPHIAVITKVSLVHAANFQGLDAIREAKEEIFASPKTHVRIANLDVGSRFASCTYSLKDAGADLYLDGRGRIFERGALIGTMRLPFTESHFLENFLAAAQIARALGLSWDEIQSRAGSLHGPKMRFEKIEIGGVLFINDAYNAAEDSMVAAIENLPEPQKGGRRILVFAPMAELGAFSREAHERVAKAALKAADHFLCLGKSYPGGKRFEKLEALASHLQAFLREGDVVLIKGSRAYEMEKIFALLNPARGYHKP